MSGRRFWLADAWAELAVSEEPRRWQPWPMADALVHRERIVWPSDDWPRSEPVPAIEDRLPDVPPRIVNWNAQGNLLDMWV